MDMDYHDELILIGLSDYFILWTMFDHMLDNSW